MNVSMSLAYGSASLQGFLWKDYTCLQPLNLGQEITDMTNATYLASLMESEDQTDKAKKI